jgi:hypothetical protein
MESMISRLFLNNWQRKAVALIAAMIIWLFVNHSITGTKTIPNVPIRVINLRQDKTIQGLLPNGILSKRITLTLSGSKEIIEDLEPGDLRVVLDASNLESDEWIVQITKKNIESLDPNIDLAHHITQVEYSEFVIKLSNLVTVKVPVSIGISGGQAPAGYEFLDLWPEKLQQTISGPEEDVLKLKEKGLEVLIDLNEITQADLENSASQAKNSNNDEITFIVPAKWKQVAIPFHSKQTEELNDPEAQYLRIYFLKKQFLAIDRPLPIRVFYPLKTSDSINPESYSLALSEHIQKKNDLTIFSLPLYVSDVSRLFLEIIKDNMEITIIAAPLSEREILEWGLEVINPHELEDTYVAYLVSNLTHNKSGQGTLPKSRETLIRKRFRDYLQRLALFSEPGQKLILESSLLPEKKEINVLTH